MVTLGAALLFGHVCSDCLLSRPELTHSEGWPLPDLKKGMWRRSHTALHPCGGLSSPTGNLEKTTKDDMGKKFLYLVGMFLPQPSGIGPTTSTHEP